MRIAPATQSMINPPAEPEIHDKSKDDVKFSEKFAKHDRAFLSKAGSVVKRALLGGVNSGKESEGEVRHLLLRSTSEPISAAEPNTLSSDSFQHVAALAHQVAGKIASASDQINKHPSKKEVEEFGLKLIRLYEMGLGELKKIEPNVNNHINFSQSVEHTVANAGKQKGKDKVVDEKLKKYNRAASFPILDREKRYAELRQSLQDFARPQAKEMAVGMAKGTEKSINDAIKKACLIFLQNQYEKSGPASFSGPEFAFANAVDSKTAQSFLSAHPSAR